MSPPLSAAVEPKLCARSDLAQRAAALARPMVFTNGVFDLLHRGHVECLAAARREGGSLVVGINSDCSVRLLGKGALRPLVAEADRAAVIAALAAVSLVVVFDEATPAALIDLLRPDVYVKGGDYRVETLAEARQVAAWGGRALTMNFVHGRSTSALVEKIRCHALAEANAASVEFRPPLRRAAFLDRDGVVNVDRGYVWRIDDFELLPGVVEALQLLAGDGHALVVVTNQSGIARGLYSEADHAALSDHLRAMLDRHGITLDGIYHCPHHPQAAAEMLRIDCDCRKPGPGLIRRAAAELQLDIGASLLVGDRLRDIAAGRGAGVRRCYLVGEHDAGTDDLAAPDGPDAVYADLYACARAVCGRPRTAPSPLLSTTVA